MVCCVFFFLFFFKQKTAYEMRISDWSSDVCSSDLTIPRSTMPSPSPAIVASRTSVHSLSQRMIASIPFHPTRLSRPVRVERQRSRPQNLPVRDDCTNRAIMYRHKCERSGGHETTEIGSASWRERGVQYV